MESQNTGSIPPELQAKIDRWAKNAAMIMDEGKNQPQDDPMQEVVKELHTVATSLEAASMLLSKSDGQDQKIVQSLEQMVTNVQSLLDKEPPDAAAPVVAAVARLEAQIKNLKAPVVTIPSPQVMVDAPDLSEISSVLKQDIPAAFERAVGLIPQQDFPETDFTPFVDRLDTVITQLQDIDKGVRLKPLPGTMKVTNPDGSLVTSGADVIVNDSGYKGIVVNNGQRKYEFELSAAGVVGPIDCRGYNWVRIQFTTVGTVTMAPQFTLDNQTNWQSPNSWINSSSTTNALTSTLTSNTTSISESQVMGAWFRLNVTALTGTQKGIVTFYTIAPPARTFGVGSAQSGNWNYRSENTATAAVPVAVAASASSVTLKASNTNRRTLTVYNDCDKALYLATAATATTAAFNVKIAPAGYYELPQFPIYSGLVAGIWDAAPTGNAMVTEGA